MSNYKLLTLRQTANLLQVNERDIGQMLRDGYLHGYKLGRGWRISLDDLNSFIRKHGDVSRDQLRSGNAANRLNGAKLNLDAQRLSKDAGSTEKSKTIGGTRAINNSHAHRETDSSTWVAPWREDE